MVQRHTHLVRLEQEKTHVNSGKLIYCYLTGLTAWKEKESEQFFHCTPFTQQKYGEILLSILAVYLVET